MGRNLTRSDGRSGSGGREIGTGRPFLSLGAFGLILLVAAALRMRGCFTFPFFGDEGFSLGHTRGVRQFFSTWDPADLSGHLQGVVVWALNASILDCFSNPVHAIRVFPLLFGVAFFPVFFWLLAGRFGTPAMLICLTILALNPTHILFSQHGRYHSAVFFLANLALLSFFLSFERRSWKLFVASQVLLLLSFFSHPGAGILLTAEVAFIVVVVASSWRRVLDLFRGRDPFVLTVAGTFLITGFLVMNASIPILIGWRWISTIQGDFTTLSFLAGTLLRIGLPLSILAFFAAVHFVLRRDPAGVFLSLALVCPILTGVALFWLKLDVSPSYVAYIIFPAGLLAARFLVEVIPVSGVRREGLQGVWSGEILLVACTLVLAFGDLPGLLSHYVDGSRPDTPGAVEWIENQRHGSGAIVVVGNIHAQFYYQQAGTPFQQFRGDPSVDEVLRSAEEGNLTFVWHQWWADLSSGERTRLAAVPHWVIWSATRDGLTPAEPYRQILSEGYVLEARIGRPRFDHRQNYLLIFGPWPSGDEHSGPPLARD